MLKRIRTETHRKNGPKLLVIFADDSRREASEVTILGSGPVVIKASDSPFVWIETTDQLIIDGEHVP